MIIEINIEKYVSIENENIRFGLAKIDANECGILFLVNDEGQLSGVVSDGDFRRWIVGQNVANLDRPLSEIMNRNFVSARLTDNPGKIQSILSDAIKSIPLTDDLGRCVAIARHRDEHICIHQRKIGHGFPGYLIAEIGNNHNGSLKLAMQLVDKAVEAGADCAKFQMRDLGSLYRNTGNSRDASEDLGSQYTMDLLSKFQLPNDDMFCVFDYCLSKNIQPLCTPWDLNSLNALEHWGVPAYKVASADLTNHEFLSAIVATGKPMIVSTGMSTDSEIADAVNLLKRSGGQFALLHCNSTYPAPFKDINLSLMAKLRSLGKCPVGYSSHDRGIHISVAAISLGANIIEKHFTIDRNMEGNDHRVSLLPGEFEEMAVAIRCVEEALGSGESRYISQGELMNREILGKSLVINCDLDQGMSLSDDMIEIRSPGRGLPPYRKKDVIGKHARRGLKKGDILYESDFSDAHVGSRHYRFIRPFGIPIRYHDLQTLGSKSNFDLLEFHLSYMDLEEDFRAYFEKSLDMDLVVHAPELFENDHILDLCSTNPGYRRNSIAELAKVVDITRQLKRFFPRATRPRIVVNVGGVTQDAPLPVSDRAKLYDIVIESLGSLDLSGVEIIPQTMPPFPWHFGGQRYHNLFIDPEEISNFCRAHDMRVCLDISHSKLACNYNKWSFTDFIEKVGPWTSHIHIADAKGVDGEGLQIDEGEIAFVAMGRALQKTAPQASFIPEVWQGHKNEGEGFWVALERLERYL